MTSREYQAGVCRAKRVYKTKRSALKAVRSGVMPGLEPYQCSVCTLWHLTSTERGRGRRRALWILPGQGGSQ